MNKPRLTQQQQKLQKQLDMISTKFKRHMAAGQYQQAMQEATRAHKLIPKSTVPLSDAATAAAKGGLWEDCIMYAKKTLQRNPNHINALDALAHAYGGMEDWHECGRYGLQALTLRDQQVMQNAETPLLPTLPAKPEGKKIIAFSLFGSSSEYLEPAVLNTQLVGKVYPGWVCRFYIDASVPEQAVQRLREHGAEVIEVEEALQSWPGTMWRFLAINDPEAAYIIFRDADSVISQREAKAVAEWMDSGKLFHTLRDAGTHTELILAGLWGAVAGAVPDMRAKIEAYLSKPLVSRHFADQFFLREQIWAYVRQSVCAHDRIFGFMDAQPFPDRAPFDYDRVHVGCNEGNSHFQAAMALPDGARVLWRLFSQVSPLVNEDYSYNTQTERLVCAYEATVKNGQIEGLMPRRYSQGVAQGLTKITVAPLDV